MFTADSRPSDDDLRENNARRVDAPAAPHAVSEVIAQASTSPDIITLKPETN